MATIRTPEGKVRTRPGVDGSVLPDTARAIFESGRQNRVPVIVDWHADEGSLAVRNAPEEVDALAIEFTSIELSKWCNLR